VLLHRLDGLPGVIEARRRNAALYRAALPREHVFCPEDEVGAWNTFHTFVVQVDRRDELAAFLAERGIATAVHYPIPIHLQPAARDLGHHAGAFPVAERQAKRILSLPIHQFLRPEDITRIAGAIAEFYA
jgi:dTDP-4-amino-4,6-dideoxygalactose transaminase